MLLKTYDSDIFNNWIQTDWIDGAGGITEITSIDINANDGKLTMDALNLQQKVYDIKNKKVTAPQTQRGGGGGGLFRTWGGSKYTPTSAIQFKQFKQYYSFPDIKTTSTIPVSVMEPQGDDVSIPQEQLNKSITAKVVGYDEDSDKIILKVTKDFRDIGYSALASGAEEEVAVKRSSIAPETFNDLEVVKDGKYIKLGSLPIKKAEAPVKKKLY